jgi:hypothetical protein
MGATNFGPSWPEVLPLKTALFIPVLLHSHKVALTKYSSKMVLGLQKCCYYTTKSENIINDTER